MYTIVFTKKAVGDIEKLKTAKLDGKAKALIDILRVNPYQSPPSFEKLQGDMRGAYSRRINMKHRLIYEVIDDQNTVKIISIWTHMISDRE